MAIATTQPDGPAGQTAAERPVVNIEGERVALGPLRRDLLPTYHRWFNEFGTLRTLGDAPRPLTFEGQAAAYDALVAGGSDRVVPFTIYERATWRPIGTASLNDVDHRHGTAELVLIIGEAECRGRGYGTETVRLLLDYGFTALGLRNIMLKVYEYNLAGIRAYQKAGFREIGRRRRAHLMGGRSWDVIYMDCLASEFASPVLGAVFVPDVPKPDRPAPRD